ncbi:MAG: CPBP family intramembrane glutamic endopeptidase [Methylococcales bacterium]
MPAPSRLRLSTFPLLYLIVIACSGALLAYPIFILVEGQYSFSRIINRCGLVLLVLGIYPMMKWQSLSRFDIGYLQEKRFYTSAFITSFGVGIVILGILVASLLALNIREPKQDELEILGILAKSAGTGLIVALLEETLFRGLLFTTIRKYATPLLAIIISALYYAALHFLHSKIKLPIESVHWYSGFPIVLDGFQQIISPNRFDSLLALFTVGVLLAMVRHYFKKGLIYCIGLHASWVFILKTTKYATDLDKINPFSGLVGDYDGIIGYLAALWLSLLIVGFYYWANKKSPGFLFSTHPN